MNTRQLRKSIKTKWLNYYIDNRQWLTRLRIWVDCDGQRRPSSSFILATLSILEPQLNQLLPLIVDLSSNPDRIVAALGLNFNPDEHPLVIAHLKQLDDDSDLISETEDNNGSVKLLPASLYDTPTSFLNHNNAEVKSQKADNNLITDAIAPSPNPASLLSKMDEGCTGGRYRGEPEEQI